MSFIDFLSSLRYVLDLGQEFSADLAIGIMFTFYNLRSVRDNQSFCVKNDHYICTICLEMFVNTSVNVSLSPS